MVKRITAAARGQQGFTLVEVVVVLIIIGILAGIAIPRLTGITTQAKEQACEANRRAIETAIIGYSAANGGKIPTGVAQLVPGYLENEPHCPLAAEKGYSIAGDGTVTCDNCTQPDND